MTAEEKAFRDKIDRVELEELMYDEFYELIAEAKKIGYAKAMRWRDPEKELPEEGQTVQMKLFNGHDNRMEYDHDKYLGKNIWDRNTSKYIEIMGWRPIE